MGTLAIDNETFRHSLGKSWDNYHKARQALIDSLTFVQYKKWMSYIRLVDRKQNNTIVYDLNEFTRKVSKSQSKQKLFTEMAQAYKQYLFISNRQDFVVL